MFTSRTIGDFLTQAALNRISGPGVCRQAAVGTFKGLGPGQVANVWDNGGLRTYLTTAQEVFVSSTNALDTSFVFIRALDANFESVVLTAVLNGQTQVRADLLGQGPISSPVIHVQSAVCAVPPAPLGDVYIALSTPTTGGVPDDITTLQSKMLFPNNITRNATFVVPSGKFAALLQFRGNTNATDRPVALTVTAQGVGQNIIRQTEFTVGTNFPGFEFRSPVATADFLGTDIALFPEKTTIDFVVTSVANGTNISFGAGYLLFGNEYLEQ